MQILLQPKCHQIPFSGDAEALDEDVTLLAEGTMPAEDTLPAEDTFASREDVRSEGDVLSEEDVRSEEEDGSEEEEVELTAICKRTTMLVYFTFSNLELF